MALDQGQETVTLTKADRTTRIEMWIDDSEIVHLRFFREVAYRNGGGVIYKRVDAPTVNRTQAQIAAKSYTAAGATRTGNQILSLVNKLADDERLVDIG